MVEGITSAAVTVVSGVVVYLVGEISQEIWLKPLQEYKQLRSKIATSLSYNAQYYSNPVDYAKCDNEMRTKLKDAADSMRKLSSELDGYIETISWFHPGIPSKEKLYEASRNIMGISNNFFCPYNTDKTLDTAIENRNMRNKINELMKTFCKDRS